MAHSTYQTPQSTCLQLLVCAGLLQISPAHRGGFSSQPVQLLRLLQLGVQKPRSPRPSQRVELQPPRSQKAAMIRAFSLRLHEDTRIIDSIHFSLFGILVQNCSASQPPGYYESGVLNKCQKKSIGETMLYCDDFVPASSSS